LLVDLSGDDNSIRLLPCLGSSGFGKAEERRLLPVLLEHDTQIRQLIRGNRHRDLNRGCSAHELLWLSNFDRGRLHPPRNHPCSTHREHDYQDETQ
jgi:hypothetical protein